MHRWAGTVRPRVITLENVKQIRDWCPLIAKRDKATGRVCKLDGTVAATWHLDLHAATITIAPLTTLRRGDRDGIEAEARRLLTAVTPDRKPTVRYCRRRCLPAA